MDVSTPAYLSAEYYVLCKHSYYSIGAVITLNCGKNEVDISMESIFGGSLENEGFSAPSCLSQFGSLRH